jgi:hypothetical protein
MKYRYLLFLLVLFSQRIDAQDPRLENIVPNTSIRGYNEWENLISETTLRGKLDYTGDNSFVRHFEIKTVEKLSINTKSDKSSDTICQYLIEYDTNGLLRRISEGGCETLYNYDKDLNFITSNIVCSALIEKVSAVEILPNIEKRFYDPTLLVRKEFYFDKMNKPFKIFKYYYSKNLLLEKIIIKDKYASLKEIVFRYTHYK